MKLVARFLFVCLLEERKLFGLLAQRSRWRIILAEFFGQEAFVEESYEQFFVAAVGGTSNIVSLRRLRSERGFLLDSPFLLLEQWDFVCCA